MTIEYRTLVFFSYIYDRLDIYDHLDHLDTLVFHILNCNDYI